MAMSVATTKHLTAIGLLDLTGEDPGKDDQRALTRSSRQ